MNNVFVTDARETHSRGPLFVGQTLIQARSFLVAEITAPDVRHSDAQGWHSQIVLPDG